MSQGASHRCFIKGATLAGVSDKVIELTLIGHQPSGLSSSVSLTALHEFAFDASHLVEVFWKPEPGLFLESDDGLADFEGG